MKIIEQKIDANNLKLILSILPEKHRKILKLKHGIIDGHEHSFQEIADKFNCSKQNIFFIYKRSIKILREALQINEN